MKLTDRYIKRLSIAAVLVVLGLLVLQMGWIHQSIHLQEEQIALHIRSAMHATSMKLERIQAAERIEPKMKRFKMYCESESCQEPDSQVFLKRKQKHHHFEKKTEISTIVWTDEKTKMLLEVADELEKPNVERQHIRYRLIDSLLHHHFQCHGIPGNYIWGVTDDNVLLPAKTYQNHEIHGLEKTPFQTFLFPMQRANKPFMLKVFFPEISQLVYRSLIPQFLISLLLLVTLGMILYLALSSLWKQKKISEIRTDFFNNVTHELKTPIATIGLAGEMLQDSDVQQNPSQVFKRAQIIRDENNRLSLLVDQILQAASLDKGALQLKFQKINFMHLLQEVITPMNIQAKHAGGQIQLISSLDAIEIEADNLHLAQVFRNLLDNSLKYCTEMPDIQMIVEQKKQFVLVKIQDNGIGISKENLDKIFEPMFRVHTGNVHDVKGFGLGLSYVKGIIEKHQGKISVSSQISKGSTFIIELPLSQKNV